MDGAAEITQAPIPVGKDYVYEFEARQAGTYFYHTHARIDTQLAEKPGGLSLLAGVVEDENVEIRVVGPMQESVQAAGQQPVPGPQPLDGQAAEIVVK